MVIAFVVLVVGVCAWAFWNQRRLFPPGSERIDEPEDRPREPRWFGLSGGGGRG
jgi:cbb3-type cytochrome oxidase subunit 3